MIARLILLAVFIPAAPDNKVGTDAVDLWICRRIAAQSFYDPAGFQRLRTAIDQHRKETP